MKFTAAIALTLLAAVPLPAQTSADRAEKLAASSLKIVKVERLAHAAGVELVGDARVADSLFNVMVQSYDGGPLVDYLKDGGGKWAGDIEKFLRLTDGLELIEIAADPAVALTAALVETGKLNDNAKKMFEAYEAAFLLVLDGRRELRLRLGIVEFLLETGAPVSLVDVSLSRNDTLQVKKIAVTAAAQAKAAGVECDAEAVYLALIRLDDLAGRFGHRQNETDLAERLMATEEFSRIRGKLEKLEPMTVGFFGDSQTDNRHWSSPAHYPKIIEEIFRRINPAVRVFNAGVGGDDSGEGLARIDKDVLSRKPDFCFVMFGGNDCAYWGRDHPSVSPGQFQANLDEIAARLKAAGCRPVLMTYPLTPEFGPPEHETLRQMNRILSIVRDEHGAGWIPLGEEIDGRDSRRMFAVDNIHLSPQAHLLLARIILEYLCDTPRKAGARG